jgi:lipopolysaccharide export system protein LptA
MVAVCLVLLLLGVAGLQRASAAPPAATSTGGALASLPVRGLAATIAEAGQIEVPAANPREMLRLKATQASRWTEGAYDVWHLTGGVELRQGKTTARSHEAVIWLEQSPSLNADGGMPTAPPLRSVLVRMAGSVEVESASLAAGEADQQAVVRSDRWAGRFWIIRDPQLDFTSIVPTGSKPAIYEAPADGTAGAATIDLVAAELPRPVPAAEQQVSPDHDEGIVPAQFAEFGSVPSPAAQPIVSGRRLRAFPRSSLPLAVQWFPSPAGTEWIAVITSGINLIVDGVDPAGPLDISADRMVIWTRSERQPDLAGDAGQSADTPLELYMEGNVVFRQGQRVIEAVSMFYDVPRSSGVITGASVLTPVDSYAGLIRLRADVLRQVDRSRFVAEQSGLTTSRMGVPTWEFRSRELTLTDEQLPVPGPFGMPMIDPTTGEPVVEHQQFVTSRGNTVTLGGIPVLWWPVLATNAEKPTFYINDLKVKNDQIFGTQVLTSWDMFQVLGMRQAPRGVDWDLDVDYLSLRGPGFGTSLLYNRPQFLGLATPANGIADAWFVVDHGIDKLGLERNNFIYSNYPDAFRGRAFWRHRQDLVGGWQARGAAGWISDINFLEEYYESEWEEGYEQRTWLDFRRPIDNRQLRLLTSLRVDPFFTQSEWWPRLDHYWLAQPLVRDALSWYEHSSISYVRQSDPQAPPVFPGSGRAPQNQAGRNIWTLLPYENNVIGERLVTRQEIDLPFQAGPVKLVPYALGELGHWGQDLNQQPIDRAYGQVGIRSSLPMWTADNRVESRLWNLHGLAHKVIFEAEFSYADATQSYEQFPLYDQIDDDTINQYRRNIPFFDFGAPQNPGDPQYRLPAPFIFGPDNKYDPRTYAIRRGIGGWVTGPSELVNDLTAFRVGARQRWQTKRGPYGDRRIVDWIVLDIDGEFFPTTSQNFGQVLGLWQYDFRWHIGDRTTILSTADVDFFAGGQQLYTVGALLNRSARGSVYMGYQSFGGPITASVLTGSYTYRMSPKWASSFGSSVDLTGRNIGQRFQLVRIGESFLMSFGFNIDYSRNNVGVTFAIEPRFLSGTQFAGNGGGLTSSAAGTSALGGSPSNVPVAGAYGLE